MPHSLLFPNGFIRALLRQAVRLPFVHPAWCRFPLGPVGLRADFGVSSRPNYLYGIYHAADLAHRLGLSEISVIEFGVAWGSGLISMEAISAEVGRALGVSISVFGFDLGSGLPEPVDYRDMPYLWGKGYFEMDEKALRERLSTAELILGDVAETIPRFLSRQLPPVGFVSFDMDFYSSTKNAFTLFGGCPSSRLPRTYCYFDDIRGLERYGCFNDYTGELLAIREFNAEQGMKICQIPSLDILLPIPALWHEEIYVLHDFEHPLYCKNIAAERDLVHFPLGNRDRARSV